MDTSSRDQFGQFFSPPEFLDYADQNQVFNRVMDIRQDRVLITGSSTNPESFTAAAVGLLTCYVPSVRATRVDPLASAACE